MCAEIDRILCRETHKNDRFYYLNFLQGGKKFFKNANDFYLPEDAENDLNTEKSKEENRNEKNMLLAILENAPYAIWFFDSRSNLMYINPKAVELTGYTACDIKNETELFERMLPDFDCAGEEVNYMANDAVYEIKCKDGSLKYFSFKPSILPGGSLIIYGNDVTEKFEEEKRRLLNEIKLMEFKEEAEKASIKKNEFIANMSHELRTPLNINLGAIQLFEAYIKSGDMDMKKITKHLNSMKQNSLRLLRLVNHLIDITKIDSGFYKPFFCNQDIVAFVKKVMESVADYAEQKGIDLMFDSGVGELIIPFDDGMMEQILLNLISNAMKYTRNLIQVSICSSSNAVFITVKDNGIGVEESKQELIFERYTQVSNLLTREHEGSGIGLSLAKSLVELHGGRIKLKSIYGKGCKFIVELPMRQKCGAAANAKDSAENSGQSLKEKAAMAFSDIGDILLKME